MKKNNKIISLLIIITMVISMLFVLTGCGKKFDMGKISGKYELIELAENNTSYSKDEIKELKEMGITFTLELKENGTGTIELYGEKSDLKYDENNIIVDNDIKSYSFENNKISIVYDDIKMVFEKK